MRPLQVDPRRSAPAGPADAAAVDHMAPRHRAPRKISHAVAHQRVDGEAGDRTVHLAVSILDCVCRKRPPPPAALAGEPSRWVELLAIASLLLACTNLATPTASLLRWLHGYRGFASSRGFAAHRSRAGGVQQQQQNHKEQK